MSTGILPQKRARQRRDGGYRLRVRAVLYEAEKAQVYSRPSGKPQTHTSLPDRQRLAVFPDLKQHVDRFNLLPSVTRSRSKMAARIKRAHSMHRHGGELAFVRLTLTDLDHLPLRAASTVAQARQQVTALVTAYAPGALAFDACLQRGQLGGTHAHILLPVASLASLLRRKAQRAPAGKGGGVEALPGVHVVRVADSEDDRAAVAVYMGRDPDGRLGLDDANNPDYLAALDELLQHRASGEESQLTWSRLPRAWRS